MKAPNGQVIFRRRRDYVECICDHCLSMIMIPEPRASGQRFHFCNRQCFKAGTRVGSRYVESRNRTCLARYGVTHISKLSQIRTRKSILMREHLALTDLAERRQQTNLEKYGVTNPYQAAHVKAKIKALYGNENPFNTEKGQQEAREGTRRKYGVDSVFQLEQYRRLGNTPTSIAKRQASIRKSGGMRRSKVETRFYESLCRLFGNDVIYRDVNVNGWSIDFWIEPLDVYVQFDGIYFHGLDRPFDRLSTIIRRTYLRDREQVAWFQAQGRLLLRVTDKQYKGNGEDDTYVLSFISDSLAEKACA